MEPSSVISLVKGPDFRREWLLNAFMFPQDKWIDTKSNTIS